MQRLTAGTMKRLGGLSPTDRTQVIAIVRRHREACERQGVEVEDAERLVIEAMDEVRAGRGDDYLEAPMWSSPEHWTGEHRCYEQYRSPVDCGRW